jgi:two-component system OmpR family sensor kinase
VIGPRTLFGKLLLLFLGFGALMTGVFLFMMRVSHERYHLEFDQQVNQDLARHYVAADLLVLQSATGEHPFGSSLRRIIAINPNVDVYVLDAQGHVLDAAVGAGRIVRTGVDVAPIERFLQGRGTFPLLGDDPTDSRDRDVFSVARLSIRDSAAAYLYVVLNRHEEVPAAARLKTLYAIGEDAGVVLAATLLAFVGSVVFLRILTRRLGALQQDIERFRDDRFVAMPPGPPEVGQSPADEIERLRRLFVQLAERIREQMQELHKTDDMRRELLANVSHDLRTPLTTLQTHLETLSMKDDLAGQEQRNYLAIALQQCRRLVKLVDQLLELAKLDARQMPFAPEPFHLAELAQDVVLKSTLSARRAGVTLSMEPPHAEVPLVMGDVALIERVLDNMLENAIRYARTGGSVTVSVKPEAQLVRLAVHDTGSGIPESERERVFDRFYRGEKHRSTASGHAGLGLSIARGILELHGRSIDFASAPDSGTTFFFELPVVSPPALKHDQRAGWHANDGSAAAQGGR